MNVSRFTFDLDRGIHHYNFNLQKRAGLLGEQGDMAAIDVDLPEEEWFVPKAIQAGVQARQLACADHLFRRGQLVSAALYSPGRGTNNAQKTMGIIARISYLIITSMQRLFGG